MLYPKYTLCSLVLLILHLECDFGVLLAVCVPGHGFALRLRHFMSPPAPLHGAARPAVTGTIACVPPAAESVHGKLPSVYLSPHSVCRNVLFVVWGFLCECAVGRVVRCHCLAVLIWDGTAGMGFFFCFFFFVLFL